MRGLPPVADGCSVRFSALNHGKSVTEADLTTRSGRETVRALVSRADVFLHNWAPGKAEALRLDADALHAVNPAWCTPPPPDSAPPSARSRRSAPTTWPRSTAASPPRSARGRTPAPSLMTVTDVLGGLVLAQAVLAGLLARQETGRGCRAASSLLSAAALVPRPARRVALSPLDRPLPTADGLLYLGAEARALPGRWPGPSAPPAPPRWGSGCGPARRTRGWPTCGRRACRPSPSAPTWRPSPRTRPSPGPSCRPTTASRTRAPPRPGRFTEEAR